ncbi:DUF397 domain-containing protein [Nocardia sp. CDC160]|uniref:DUF397 domain-containing protein n=1 Tax=Nocardia sp. CDC160 TaxID=3112166 RepID=UPI002DB6B43E|nr:DUF397 domain-containing protein [Nocardia sp. CDC160]MEC3913299.1 DUF397 domain-containing protein [Nocardia sp. CDC160]
MGAAWFKSTFSSAEQTCVEVALLADAVLVRDSKYTGPAQSQPMISVPPNVWPVLLELALSDRVGELGEEIILERRPDGSTAVIDRQGIELLFTAPEWDAFARGVADGQFDLE